MIRKLRRAILLVIRQLGNCRRRPAGRIQTVTSEHHHHGLGSAETQMVVCCSVLSGNLATQSLLRGLVQPDHFSGIQLILRLDYRQLALFFGVPQNFAVRQHIHRALVHVFFDCGFD